MGIPGLDVPEAWIERADETAFIARSGVKAHIYNIHPGLKDWGLLFRFGKRSRAALEGVGGSKRDYRGSTIR